jgi:hypothetical protein
MWTSPGVKDQHVAWAQMPQEMFADKGEFIKTYRKQWNEAATSTIMELGFEILGRKQDTYKREVYYLKHDEYGCLENKLNCTITVFMGCLDIQTEEGRFTNPLVPAGQKTYRVIAGAGHHTCRPTIDLKTPRESAFNQMDFYLGVSRKLGKYHYIHLAFTDWKVWVGNKQYIDEAQLLNDGKIYLYRRPTKD